MSPPLTALSSNALRIYLQVYQFLLLIPYEQYQLDWIKLLTSTHKTYKSAGNKCHPLGCFYIYVWTPEQILNYVDHLEIFYSPAVLYCYPLNVWCFTFNALYKDIDIYFACSPYLAS